jgi:hypothetical protein
VAKSSGKADFASTSRKTNPVAARDPAVEQAHERDRDVPAGFDMHKKY